MWIGVVFIGLAFLPKALSLILAIPGPVAGAYLLVLISVLFVLLARVDRQTAELEFIAAPGGTNIEDRLVLMTPEAPAPIENELSLRLLRHFASSVQHQQYHDTDVLTVTVSSDSKEPSGQVDTAGI